MNSSNWSKMFLWTTYTSHRGRHTGVHTGITPGVSRCQWLFGPPLSPDFSNEARDRSSVDRSLLLADMFHADLSYWAAGGQLRVWVRMTGWRTPSSRCVSGTFHKLCCYFFCVTATLFCTHICMFETRRNKMSHFCWSWWSWQQLNINVYHCNDRKVPRSFPSLPRTF